MAATLIILVISIAVLLLWFGVVPRRARLVSGANRGVYTDVLPAHDGLKLGTYNIHGGKGADGLRDLKRTAGVIAGTGIVALQEVRSGWFCDQTGTLQSQLGTFGLFAPTVQRWFHDYRGNSLLSVFPVDRWRSYHLPNAGGRRYRIYTVAEVSIGGQVLSVLFTHLHTRAGREQQLKIVLEHFGRLPVPAVLIGDLNSRRDDPVFAGLPGDAVDGIAQALGAKDTPRVDWIFTRGLEIKNGGRVDSEVSDHPYFWIEVRLQLFQAARCRQPATVTVFGSCLSRSRSTSTPCSYPLSRVAP